MPDGATADSGPANWWNPDWTRRRKLVFDNSAQNETLVDFVALVALDSGNIDYGVTQNLGEDVRFTDPAGTALAYEIESWNEFGGSFVWVKVPRIGALSSSDHIWMYYGNPTVADGQNPAAVWSNGFRGVWHLPQDPAWGADAMRDSTGNLKHGTAFGTLANSPALGQIANGTDFSARTGVIGIGNSASGGNPLDIVGGPLTLEAWIYPTAHRGMVIAKRDDTRIQWQFYIEHIVHDPEIDLAFAFSDASGHMHVWYSPTVVPPSAWSHCAVVIDSSGVPQRFYLNGTAQVPVAYAVDAEPPQHYDVGVAIGGRWTTAPAFADIIGAVADEVRVSAAQRSAAWMAANQLNTTYQFVTFAEIESR